MKKLTLKASYLFIIATILFGMICYRFAFKHTIEAWQQNNAYQQQLANSNSLNYDVTSLGRKAANINKVFNHYKTDTSAFRNNIIDKISFLVEKENVKLVEIPPSDPAFNTNRTLIQKIVLNGDYFALIRVIDQLQKTETIGVIRALTMKSTGGKVKAINNSEPLLEIYLIAAK